jgi:hypothetical protein
MIQFKYANGQSFVVSHSLQGTLLLLGSVQGEAQKKELTYSSLIF